MSIKVHCLIATLLLLGMGRVVVCCLRRGLLFADFRQDTIYDHPWHQVHLALDSRSSFFGGW